MTACARPNATCLNLASGARAGSITVLALVESVFATPSCCRPSRRPRRRCCVRSLGRALPHGSAPSPARPAPHNTARPHAHRFAAAPAPAAASRTRQMRGPWTRLRRRCRCLRRSLCCLPACRSARPASQAVRACVDEGRSRSTRTRGPGLSATVARSDACPGCRPGRSPAPRLRRIWCHTARRSTVLRRDAGFAACP